MLTCIAEESKNKNPKLCYDKDIIGGMKDQDVIEGICMQFYGEKDADKCTNKNNFCSMCCKHFIGIRFLGKIDECKSKCTIVINSK